MTTIEAIDQLYSLRQNSMASIDNTDPEDIFAADVEALDMAIENLKIAFLENQGRFISRDEEIQGNLLGLVRRCIDVKRIGIDCFFYYSPHVNHVSIDIYKRGWRANHSPDISLGIYLDDLSETVLSRLKECHKSLTGAIREICKA